MMTNHYSYFFYHLSYYEDTMPMKIIAEYGNTVVNGAGCGGVEANGSMFINAGVSASASGATQSTFTLYSFEDSA
jgi:hypothetical protein